VALSGVRKGNLEFFGNSGPHAKIQNLRTIPSGRKVTKPEERRRREIMPLIVDTNVCHAARLQRRMGSTSTSLRPTFSYMGIYTIVESGKLNRIPPL
jgi:hypothetical protein